MAKLITKQVAVERSFIKAIVQLSDGISIYFTDNRGTFLKNNPHYDSIVRWWRSPCEVDLVPDKFPECCCNKHCKCCKLCCNNN
jgi:hypothetical protein